MPLTNDEKAKIIAAVTAAVDGVPAQPPPPPIVWYKDTTTPAPTVPLTDFTNESELKRYMAHGVRANLTRGVAESDWTKYLAIADKVFNAASPQEANVACPGAGYFTPDVAVYLILGGGTQGGTFTPISIFAGWNTGYSLTQAAEWLINVPVGPGPSGQ